MTCRNPPFVSAVWRSADVIAPSRNSGSDGGCPSQEHHQNNPNSDHEPSGPNNYCHAVDVTVDPPRFDPRDYVFSIVANPFWRKYLKYIVLNWTGWHGAPLQEDSIWDFALGDTHWRNNGGYSHHESPHMHTSFYGITEQITSPLFVAGAPMPQPTGPIHDEETMGIVQPGKKPRLKGRTPMAHLNVAGKCVELTNGAAIKYDHSVTGDADLRRWPIGARPGVPSGNIPGTPIAMAEAAPNRPGGPGVVVLMDNHITVDGYWS